MDYQFRRISEADLPALARLYALSFNQTPTAEALAEKLSTRCFGADYIGYLAITPEGDFAAFYGVYPVEMNIAGQVIIGAQSGDTMTHPKHRKRGLFIHLAKLTYALAAAQQVKVIFGFPNDQSFPGFQRHLGWTFLEPMLTAEFKIGRGAHKLKFLRWMQGKRHLETGINIKLESIKVDSSNLIFDANADGVRRDGKYLQYKQRNSGSLVVRFNDLLIWLVPGIRLDIGGFLENTPMNPDRLADNFQQLLQYCGARSARFTYSAGSLSLRSIESFCDVQPTAKPGYLLLDPTLTIETLWFCRGDFDFF